MGYEVILRIKEKSSTLLLLALLLYFALHVSAQSTLCIRFLLKVLGFLRDGQMINAVLSGSQTIQYQIYVPKEFSAPWLAKLTWSGDPGALSLQLRCDVHQKGLLYNLASFPNTSYSKTYSNSSGTSILTHEWGSSRWEITVISSSPAALPYSLFVALPSMCRGV